MKGKVVNKRQPKGDQQGVTFAFCLRDGMNASCICYYMPGTPIQNALLGACGDRWNQLLAILADLQEHGGAYKLQTGRQIVQLSSECLQLAGWVFAEDKSSRAEGIIRILSFLKREYSVPPNTADSPKKKLSHPAPQYKIILNPRDSGFQFAEIAIDADIDPAPRTGAPATLRANAIHALELRLLDESSWPWSRLANDLCKCGGTKHELRCQQNVRREVQHLKALLRQLHISVG